MSRESLAIVASFYHASCSAWRICNVMDFGAAGDGHTLDTSAITSALQACRAGGTVWLPRADPGVGAPLRFLSSPFNLSSNIELRVDATLLATTDVALWPVLPKLPSFPDGVENSPGMSGRYAAFIGGEHMVNVTISGGGTIDGQGLVWWQRSGRLPGHKKTILHTRGRLVEPAYSKGIVVRDVTLKDPPFWALHLYACDSVLVEGVTVTAPVWSRNTDCIDPDSSTNVLIRNCTLSGGDDQIAIKSGQDAAGRLFGRPSANITVEDLHIPHGDGLSIGSEMSGGVFNVTFRRIKFGYVLHPLRIKTGYGRGGSVRGVLFEDIELASLGQIAGTAITVDEFDGNIMPNASHARAGWPTVGDVTFRNVRGGALTAGVLRCIPERPCTDIHLENVSVTSVRGFECSHVFGTDAGVVRPKSCITEI